MSELERAFRQEAADRLRWGVWIFVLGTATSLSLLAIAGSHYLGFGDYGFGYYISSLIVGLLSLVGIGLILNAARTLIEKPWIDRRR